MPEKSVFEMRLWFSFKYFHLSVLPNKNEKAYEKSISLNSYETREKSMDCLNIEVKKSPVKFSRAPHFSFRNEYFSTYYAHGTVTRKKEPKYCLFQFIHKRAVGQHNKSVHIIRPYGDKIEWYVNIACLNKFIFRFTEGREREPWVLSHVKTWQRLFLFVLMRLSFNLMKNHQGSVRGLKWTRKSGYFVKFEIKTKPKSNRKWGRKTGEIGKKYDIILNIYGVRV